MDDFLQFKNILSLCNDILQASKIVENMFSNDLKHYFKKVHICLLCFWSFERRIVFASLVDNDFNVHFVHQYHNYISYKVFFDM